MVDKNKTVDLNADDKAVALKIGSDLYHCIKQLYDWIKSGELEEEMKNNMLVLAESHIADLSKILKYDSVAQKKIDERYGGIREANGKIHELKRQLADKSQIIGLKELLYEMHSSLYEWWKLQGFSLVTDDEFNSFGYKGRFCLSMSHISFMSRKPVTECEIQQTKIEQMLEEGYELEIPNGDREYVLLDTPLNREKLTTLVRTKLPSIKIISWGNHLINNTEKFQLRDFEAIIYKFEELKALMDYMKKIKDDDQ